MREVRRRRDDDRGRRRRRRRRRTFFRIVHARGGIPDEVGPTRCRATPASNQSADEKEEEQFIRNLIIRARGISLGGVIKTSPQQSQL